MASDTETIDRLISKAIMTVSNPIKAISLIILDQAGGRISVSEYSEKINSIMAGSIPDYKHKNPCDHYRKMFKQGNIRYADMKSITIVESGWTKTKRWLEFTDEHLLERELLLPLPYFALEKAAEIGMPLDVLIGRTGNKGYLATYLNRTKYYLSFFIPFEAKHPTCSLNNRPGERTRKQMEKLTGIPYQSAAKQDRKFEKQGFVRVIRPEDSSMTYPNISLLLEKGERVAEFFIAINKAIVSGNPHPIAKVRESLNGDYENLIRYYMEKTRPGR